MGGEFARSVTTPGELVTETLGYGGGQQVTANLPHDPPQAVVFAGDGRNHFGHACIPPP